MVTLLGVGERLQNALRVTVPVHGNKDLGKGLLSAIERQTGVKLS